MELAGRRAVPWETQTGTINLGYGSRPVMSHARPLETQHWSYVARVIAMFVSVACVFLERENTVRGSTMWWEESMVCLTQM